MNKKSPRIITDFSLYKKKGNLNLRFVSMSNNNNNKNLINSSEYGFRNKINHNNSINNINSAKKAPIAAIKLKKLEGDLDNNIILD